VKRQIVKDVYSVGVVDWNVRNFHGHTYTTKRGSSYNAYLVIDERTALVDTVYEPFADELIENIRNIISLDKISYIVANHVEKDHSGALPEIMKLCPNAKLSGLPSVRKGYIKTITVIGILKR
jgi:anaerobic nitric oxide reductase flavorubredoxin